MHVIWNSVVREDLLELKLKNICKKYQNRIVLENLDIRIAPGDFHVLLGQSGCGKTTLLSIIAGLTRQDQGEVVMGKKNVSHWPPEKRRIGFVFQDYALFPHLTVFENIAFGLRVQKMEMSHIIEQVDGYLQKTSIEDEKNKYPHQLSGGQKQRVALARALVNRPTILLMDEPMSHLDSGTKESICKELQQIQQEMGITVLYVTHNQQEAQRLGSHISRLECGKIRHISP